ncbi:cytochrome c [Methylobacterium sp. 17Sr1-1]|uniref:c-type cytochrome n=1 Tax=Methylobacterium sp. 17Sr1-1 TaxID=2202826 RepID=UPI000D6EEC77|nr:cytochrome c [Methylobacterium sp. 17Sr1-1]AWN54215.1 gluconate 2-dehydrogenase [Methylobacterium sp. 17Sr1-1]
MRRQPVTRRRTLTALLGSGALAFAAGTALAQPASSDLVEKGRYLATAGDCVACHTAPGGKPYAGGLTINFPGGIGKLATPNITPDKQTGIGSWSDDDFRRAMHQGITKNGSYLYPAFPFPWYTRLSDEDVAAIKAYLFSLEPVNAPRKPTDIAFPFSIREGLLAWRLAFFTEGRFKPDPKASDEVNRGAYLVEGPGHCGACHNGSKLVGASQWSGYLEGGTIDGWYAPNLSGDDNQGLGKWSEDQLTTYLKTGAAPGRAGVVAGPMRQVIEESLSKMTDADVRAIAIYLKTLAPKPTYTPDVKSDFKSASAAPGADTYLNRCVACHRPDGQGQPGAIPPLAGNGAVLAKGPETVIRVILGGLDAKGEYAAMPAVGVGMTDAEIANVTNYVRQTFGNQAPPTAEPGQVAKLRAETQTMLAGNAPCETVSNPTLAEALKTADAAGQLKDLKAEQMLPRVATLLPAVRQAAPQASSADLVNGLTATFCQVADHDKTGLDWPTTIGSFSGVVYGQLKSPSRAEK